MTDAQTNADSSDGGHSGSAVVATDDGPDAALIAGRYRLVERLGSGSMGEVWRAHDERLDRTVAIKRLLPGASRIQRDGMREARITAKLHHPNAVTVHDVVEDDGRRCLVMSYVDGSALTGRGPLPPIEVARIGRQVAEALGAAHELGIVHRDIKPDNVLLTAGGEAVLTDFGISRVVGDGSDTGPGVVVGTPAYLAPEVAVGADAGFAADVFSLGATLYATVEGAPPFGVDDDTVALLYKVADGFVPEPTHAGSLGPVLMWMLRREPAARPSMSQVAAALGAVADGRPVVPPTATLLLEPPLRGPRVRSVAIGLAGVGIAVLGLVVGIAIGTDAHQHTSSGRPPTQGAPAAPTGSDVGCVANYSLTNTWPGGYQAQVTVRADDSAVHGWTVTLDMPVGQTITELWNGTLSLRGDAIQVGSMNYNAGLAAQASTTFGFNGAVRDQAPGTPTVSCAADR